MGSLEGLSRKDEAEGRQLLGEALLLQAAQALGRGLFDPTERSELPTNVQSVIDEAEACLNETLERWRSLRDPEPNNANFTHPTTGDEYNYRATETYRLPGAPSQPDLQMFLGNRTWVDLRNGLTTDAVEKLVWGITGTKL